MLTSAELADLNSVWDAHVDGRALVEDRRSETITDRHGNVYTGRRFWSDGYRNLVDHPKIYPILQEILGDERWGHVPPTMPREDRGRIRLDHDNLVHLPAYDPAQMETHGWGAKTLHGHDGGLGHVLTTVFELKSIGPGDGGLAAAAGSHKPAGRDRLASMGLTDEEWRTQFCDNPILGTPRHPGWDPSVPIHRCEGQAGDCLIFSEKLIHGTLPWTGGDERRTAFYKYTAWGMHHSDVGYDVSDPSLTESQRAIVEYSSCWFNNPEWWVPITQPHGDIYERNPGLSRLHPNAAWVRAAILSSPTCS